LTFQANDASKPFKGSTHYFKIKLVLILCDNKGYLAVGLDPSRTWKGPIGTMSSPSNGRIITCPSDEGVPNVIKQLTNKSAN